MAMNLTDLRTTLVTKKVWMYIVGALILMVVVITFFATKGATITAEDIPPSVNQQPVVNGTLDKEASQSVASKTGIEKIAKKLPHREVFKTSTGSSVTYSIFSKPTDPYSIYVETIGISFELADNDPDLPLNVQNFRDTSQEILKFLKGSGIKTNETFIIWGSTSKAQYYAENWLTESPRYPKVIKKDTTWQFETPPTN